MATTFKNFLNNDTTNTRTLLHEAIPITGTIVSGTYITNTETNIKNYAHGMFQSVYDYPFLSSSANHIFDLTVGFSTGSSLSASDASDVVQQAKKINIYNQMAQVLMGHDPSGTIRPFDRNGNIAEGGYPGMQNVFFVSFSRLLAKDEIKKGSFTMTVYTGSSATGSVTDDTSTILTLSDYNGETGYKVNSPAGEFGLLLTSSTAVLDADYPDSNIAGLLFYQAGIAVITSSIFRTELGFVKDVADVGTGFTVPRGASGTGAGAGGYNYLGSALTTSMTPEGLLTNQSISGSCDALRSRISNITFNNTTELNSTIYFCRANHNEFNYSSNPTYISDSKLVVKNNASDLPVSYITTIGLYSSDNELLAMAKLSEPLKKDPNTELTLRCRLDY